MEGIDKFTIIMWVILAFILGLIFGQPGVIQIEEHNYINCTPPKIEYFNTPYMNYYSTVNYSGNWYRGTETNYSICPNNLTAVEVTCDCAENTNTPCMAYCFICMNKSNMIPADMFKA